MSQLGNIEVASEVESRSFRDILLGGFSDVIDGVVSYGQLELSTRYREQFPEQFPEYGDGSRFYVDTRAAEDVNAQQVSNATSPSTLDRIGSAVASVDPVWLGAGLVGALALYVFVRR